MQYSSPRCYPHCFPVCFRDELYCCHRKWMLEYRHGSSDSRSCRKKKGNRKMLLNPKGLHCRAHFHVNKKQFLSLSSASLWLSFPSPGCLCLDRREPLFPISLQSKRAWTPRRIVCKVTAWLSASSLFSFQFSGLLFWNFILSFAGYRTAPTFSSSCSVNVNRGQPVHTLVLATHFSLLIAHTQFGQVQLAFNKCFDERLYT